MIYVIIIVYIVYKYDILCRIVIVFLHYMFKLISPSSPVSAIFK